MADNPEKAEKTEEATPKRLEDAREKGQVAFSTEVMAVTTLIAAAIGFAIGGSQLLDASGGELVRALDAAGVDAIKEMGVQEFADRIQTVSQAFIPAFLLVILPIGLIAWLIGYSQVGIRVSPKAMEFDLSKLSPIKGFGRMFSMRSVMRTLMAVLKVGLVGITVVVSLRMQMDSMSPLVGKDLAEIIPVALGILMRTASAAIVAVLALALIDLVYQRYQHTKDMRMTRKEIKDEHKNTDGDPEVKSRIRRLQREMATRRMMEDVPKSTVVITNPEHYAVALEYQEGAGAAPRCLAKGVDNMAQQIKKIARENNVVIVENPPLARALHRQVQIGDPIPEGLFQAVANVLAFVFKTRNRSLQGVAE